MADPGFPVGAGGVHPLGGCGPPTQALFGENVCENERIGSHRGWCVPGTPPPPDPPMLTIILLKLSRSCINDKLHKTSLSSHLLLSSLTINPKMFHHSKSNFNLNNFMLKRAVGQFFMSLFCTTIAF